MKMTKAAATTEKIDSIVLIPRFFRSLRPRGVSHARGREIPRLLLAGLLLAASACVSLTPKSQVNVHGQFNEKVPARKWADNRCAAGALAEVLNSLGDPVTEDRLSGALARGRKGGVVTVDLLLAARARGFDAQLIRGDIDVVRRELLEQHPMILMLRVLDLPGHKDDLFHYVVLSGFDPERELVSMHYGDGRKRWVSLEPLEPSWAAAGYATFIIGPKKKRTADTHDLERAVLLEDSGKSGEAIALYRLFLDSHPESAVGWTNLGNAYAGMNEDQLSEVAYRNALFLEKNNADALNNLAWLLLKGQRLAEAEALARRAADLAGGDRYPALDTLGRILLAGGNCPDAAATFREALGTVPGNDPEARAIVEQGLVLVAKQCGQMTAR